MLCLSSALSWLIAATFNIKVACLEFSRASAQQSNRWITDYCTAARRNVKLDITNISRTVKRQMILKLLGIFYISNLLNKCVLNEVYVMGL